LQAHAARQHAAHLAACCRDVWFCPCIQRADCARLAFVPLASSRVDVFRPGFAGHNEAR